MDLLTTLALVALGVGTVWAFVVRSWPLAFIGLGLFLIYLAASGALK
jgi:hypothetical protein